MPTTGGCRRRLSLRHMVKKGSWARSSLRKSPANNYLWSKTKASPDCPPATQGDLLPPPPGPES